MFFCSRSSPPLPLPHPPPFSLVLVDDIPPWVTGWATSDVDGCSGNDEEEENNNMLFCVTAVHSDEPLHCLCCFCWANKANDFEARVKQCFSTAFLSGWSLKYSLELWYFPTIFMLSQSGQYPAPKSTFSTFSTFSSCTLSGPKTTRFTSATFSGSGFLLLRKKKNYDVGNQKLLAIVLALEENRYWLLILS